MADDARTIMTTEQLRQLHSQQIEAQEAERAAMMRLSATEGAELDRRRSAILAYTRPALPMDYGRWLARFLAAGGAPTHFYDYPMPAEFRVILCALEVQPLYGARLLRLIVPEGIEVTGHVGHTSLFRMDDPLASKFVPIYSDSEVHGG